MLKKDVIDHFKRTSKVPARRTGYAVVARALGVSFAAVSKWGDIVPYFSACEIERITKGALRVKRDLYSRGRPRVVEVVAND
jgi:DNA-binding transcriptional regulator YdaS (Cro superfamily)